MILKTMLFGKTYQFRSVKEVLAKANEEKSGDKLAGVAAESSEERIAAKVVLAQLTLEDLFNHPVVDYDEDEVTRLSLIKSILRFLIQLNTGPWRSLGNGFCLTKQAILRLNEYPEA